VKLEKNSDFESEADWERVKAASLGERRTRLKRKRNSNKLKKRSKAKSKKRRQNKNALVDIRLRREIHWITSNIDSVGGLIHPYPVNPHRSRECEMLQVNFAEAV